MPMGVTHRCDELRAQEISWFHAKPGGRMS